MALPNQKITPKGELPDPTRFFDLVGSLAEWFVWAMNWGAYVTLSREWLPVVLSAGAPRSNEHV